MNEATKTTEVGGKAMDVTAILPTHLPVDLKTLGLSEDDLDEVKALVGQIDPENPTSIAVFGRNISDHAKDYADELLAQVRNDEMEMVGFKLTQIVSVAQSINAQGLMAEKSNIPVIGPWIDKLKRKGSDVMGQFDTAKEQIDKLVTEIRSTTTNMQVRNESLNSLYESVLEEHRQLGIHIAAGKIRLDAMQKQVADMRGNLDDDPVKTQLLLDYESAVTNLDKRIGDLHVLQHAAMQSLPTIRITQANNQMLVDKLHTVEELTIPTWKREFMLRLALNEQHNAVRLATNIDDATNEMMRRNAETLHQNAVGAARANQRMVIDVDTLRHVNTNLAKTVDEIIKIQRQGIAERKKVERQLLDMQQNLRQQLTGK